MNRTALTIRFLLFCLFFLTGAFAVVLAILAEPDLYEYYYNRAALNEIHLANQRIRDLTEQYDARVELIEKNPEILQRFSSSTFNRRPNAPDTVFPQSSNEKLRAETKKLLQAELEPKPANAFPAWLVRILTPPDRTALFLAGTGLILLTFTFFGTPRRRDIL